MAKNKDKDTETQKGHDGPVGVQSDEIAIVSQVAEPVDNGKDNKKQNPVKKAPAVRIVSKRDGFRRAGFVFSKQPTDIAIRELSEEQRAALSADPMLSLELIEIEVEA